MRASSEKNEGYVYQTSIDKRKKKKPKYNIHDLVRTADLKKMFSESEPTSWS